MSDCSDSEASGTVAQANPCFQLCSSCYPVTWTFLGFHTRGVDCVALLRLFIQLNVS